MGNPSGGDRRPERPHDGVLPDELGEHLRAVAAVEREVRRLHAKQATRPISAGRTGLLRGLARSAPVSGRGSQVDCGTPTAR